MPRFIRAEEPDVTTSQITARFRLIGLEEQKFSESYQDTDESGRTVWKTRHVPGCRVKLLAEQGGIFGNATPSGEMEMSIKDPDAARVFIQIWYRWLHDDAAGQYGAFP